MPSHTCLAGRGTSFFLKTKVLTLCMMGSFLWFCCYLLIFFKLIFSFCRSWSGSKLFAKFVIRRQKSRLAGVTIINLIISQHKHLLWVLKKNEPNFLKLTLLWNQTLVLRLLMHLKEKSNQGLYFWVSAIWVTETSMMLLSV